MLATKTTISRAIKPSLTLKKDGLALCDEKRPRNDEKEKSANWRASAASLVVEPPDNKSFIVPHALADTEFFSYGPKMGVMMVWSIGDASIAASSKDSSSLTTASSGVAIIGFDDRGRLFAKGRVHIPLKSLSSIATVDTSDSCLHYVFTDDKEDEDEELAVVVSKPKLPLKDAFPDLVDASVEKETPLEDMQNRMNMLLRPVPVPIITTITSADDEEMEDEVSPLSIADYKYYGGAFFSSDNEDEYSVNTHHYDWSEEDEDSFEDPLIVMARELGMNF
jgi:hypothetical protein